MDEAGKKYRSGPHNPHPRMILQIADCSNSIDLDDRQNSFHKIDTLIASLQEFRGGMADEVALYRKRAQQMKQEEEK